MIDVLPPPVPSRQGRAAVRGHRRVAAISILRDADAAYPAGLAVRAYLGAIGSQGIAGRPTGDPRADVSAALPLRATSHAAVAASIARLPEREQMVLQLHFVDGCTLEEIGTLFAVSARRIGQIRDTACRSLAILLESPDSRASGVRPT